MNVTTQTPLNFLSHLQTDHSPLTLKRDGKPPQWSDSILHDQQYQNNSTLYALLALLDTVHPNQKVKILFQLLKSSRKGLSIEQRYPLEQVTEILLKHLNPDDLLMVFLALRRVKANHKHTTKAIVTYLLNHPHFEDMIACRGRSIRDILEHTLGKNVVRGCLHYLNSEDSQGQAYIQQNLLKYAQDKDWVKYLLPYLYQGKPHQTPTGVYKQHQPLTSLPYPKTITATNRGDMAATLVHWYRGGESPQLKTALQDYVSRSSQQLPKIQGKIALILDVSASTRSYGEREYCTLSQSIALQLILQQNCDQLRLYSIGGQGFPPQPQGDSDLALSLIIALDDQPDLVMIISDGYENIYPKDLSKVLATLPKIGCNTPVIFCHSKFTPFDDLTYRQPVTGNHQLQFWHENDFESIFLSLLGYLDNEQNTTALQSFLMGKLTQKLT